MGGETQEIYVLGTKRFQMEKEDNVYFIQMC